MRMRVRFEAAVSVGRACSKDEYDRSPGTVATRGVRALIEAGLDTYKREEMAVHRDSRHNTLYHGAPAGPRLHAVVAERLAAASQKERGELRARSKALLAQRIRAHKVARRPFPYSK